MLLWPIWSWSLPLTIGVPASEGGLEASQTWSAICSFLDKHENLDVRFRIFADHAALLKTLRERFIDLAVLDPAWFLMKREELAPVAEVGIAGQSSCTVSLVAPKGSIIFRPEDLAGASLALTKERESAAGYFVPLAMLAKAGVRTGELKRLIFAETARSVLKGVAYGGLDCGGIPSYLLENEGELRFSDFVKVIAESKPLPLPVLVRRKEDGESRFEELRRALLAMDGRAEGRAVLAAGGLSGFHLPDASRYKHLAEYMATFETAYGPAN